MRFGSVAQNHSETCRQLSAACSSAAQCVGAAIVAKLLAMPYQRGQFWIRRFRKQAEQICTALAVLAAPPRPRTSSRECWACCNPWAGSSPTTSCLAVCECTCWAGPRFSLRTGVPPHSARRCRPPEVLTQLLDRTGNTLSLMLLAQWRSSPMDAEAEKSPCYVTA